MTLPVVVMVTPDDYCQAWGARQMLTHQLHRLGRERVVVTKDPRAAHIALLHIAPDRMPHYLASLPSGVSLVHVACPSNAWQLHQLRQAHAEKFDVVFVSALPHWSLAQALPMPRFWVPTGCACAPEHGALWRERFGLPASSCVVLAIEDCVPHAALASLPCVQRAFAYARMRDASVTLVVWERGNHAPSWALEPGGVIRLRGLWPFEEARALFAAADVFVHAHAGCDADLAQAMQAGVLCLGVEEGAQSGLFTKHNSVQLKPSEAACGVMHVHRDVLESAVLHAVQQVKSGTRLTLTRQAQRDMQGWTGALPQHMLYDALKRVQQVNRCDAAAPGLAQA